MQYTNQEIIEGVRLHDKQILQFLYKDVFHIIRWYIYKNRGSIDDANDLFQDALLVVYRKIMNQDMHLQCFMSTYIFAIVKRLWFKELRRKRKLSYGELRDLEIAETEEWSDDDMEKLKLKLLHEHFNELDNEAKKILSLHFKNYSVPVITKAMGYESERRTMERKYRSKLRLERKVKNDPLYRKIKENDI